MKLLILTQYFPPEVGAPQNRLFELAVRLKAKGVDVSVFTAMPNYPEMKIKQGYEGKKYCYEKIQDLDVHRAYIFVKKSRSIFFRLLNYFSFVFSSIFYSSKIKGKFDFVLCESPPLFLGISALYIARRKKAKLVFNVSDLWPESAEKLGLVTNKWMLGLSKRLEEYLYKKSNLITGQTQGIVKNISERFPSKKIYWLKNGVDIKYFDYEISNSSWRKDKHIKENEFVIYYGGILGHAQGLEVVLKAAKELKSEENIKFVLQGSGPQKEFLLELKSSWKLENVLFLDTASKNEMPSIVSSIDVAVVPLKKLNLFKGAIPSKIFEILAMKKPILLGVEGEAKQLFIDEARAGLAFEPENADSLIFQIKYLLNNKHKLNELGDNGYQYVKGNFNRDIIADEFYQILLKN